MQCRCVKCGSSVLFFAFAQFRVLVETRAVSFRVQPLPDRGSRPKCSMAVPLVWASKTRNVYVHALPARVSISCQSPYVPRVALRRPT